MKIPGKIIWGIYFLIYLGMTSANLIYFFSTQNQIFWYYQVLMAVDIWFIVPYLLNVLSVILNTLALIPIYGIISGRSILSARFWGYFIAIRFLMDFFGKSFEIKLLKSFFFESPVTAWASVGLMIAFSLPSYLGGISYSFHLSKNKSLN